MGVISEQQDVKREKILEASHQRFLHYGYAKTTMNEIAGDLSMSKALLYYYFPDKSELYIAVMRKLAGEYLRTLEDSRSEAHSLEEAFVFQVNTNHDFILNNYNFFDFFRINEQNLPDNIWQIVEQIHVAELGLLTDAINSDIARGAIRKTENPKEVVSLLFDALHGVRVGAMAHKKAKFPKKEHLDDIHQKRLMLIDIFIKGLKA